jgi:beta-lactamase regulating signal transducer with metallopeptidase domain
LENWIMMIDALLENLLLASATAALLAMVVAAAGYRIRQPELMHGLWILVLLKMMTPPLLPWNVLPSPFAVAEPEPALATLTPAVLTPLKPAISPGTVLMIILALGSIGLAALLLVRVVRFQRLIRQGRFASPDLLARAEQIARRIGLAAPPMILTLPAGISPVLWPAPSGCRLLLPEELLESLTARELDVLLAHELAHYRRKDHWVRYLELVVTLLFWWNPVTWWVRRRLRVAEERSCDGMVLEAFPGLSRAYADALLKTVEFTGGHGPGTPAIATGAGGAQDLKERLMMIMKRKIPGKLSPGQRLALAMLAIAVLVVFPTWADKDADPAQPTEQQIADQAAKGAEIVRMMEKLEAMELRLAEQERLLALQEHDLQKVMERHQVQIRHMQNKAQELARMDMDREQALRMEEQVQAMEARALEVDRQAREMDQQARALAEYSKQLDAYQRIKVRDLERAVLLQELEERRESMDENHPEVKELEKELQRIQEEAEKKEGTAL